MKRTLKSKSSARLGMNVKRVSASQLRRKLREQLRQVKNNRVLLVQNRRQEEKYVVDKAWLDTLIAERESVLATLEILSDTALTNMLLALAKTIDNDVANNRLYSMADAFA
jgi:PHD/YefM family antitoxin component YafN of YafNO toxin-antitoxin module